MRQHGVLQRPSNCPDRWNRFWEFFAVLKGFTIQIPSARFITVQFFVRSFPSSLYSVATSKICSEKLLPYPAYRNVVRLFSSSLEQHHFQKQVFRQRIDTPTKKSPLETYLIPESSLHNSNIDTIFPLRSPAWRVDVKTKSTIQIPTIC
jgi:hypothetical protein